MTDRKPSWEQNGVPLIVNIMQIALAKSHSARGASRHLAFMISSLTISQTRLPCPPCGKMGAAVLACDTGNKETVKFKTWS